MATEVRERRDASAAARNVANCRVAGLRTGWDGRAADAGNQPWHLEMRQGRALQPGMYARATKRRQMGNWHA